MTLPGWWRLDRDELEDYVAHISKVHKLTETQATHLLRQLRWERGFMFRTEKLNEAEAKQEIEAYGLKIETKSIGSGLTAKTITTTLREGAAAKLYASERANIRRLRRHTGKKPFSWRIAKDVDEYLKKALWACGCLQIDYEQWIVPHSEFEPHAGVWWYFNEISRLMENAQNQCRNTEAEFAAFSAFRAGELFNELGMRLAHNEFFEKQSAIADAQRSAPRSRRKQTDHERRERVRHYLRQGDKPTHAAENAARDLGVSLSTIRRSFADGLLPEGPDSF